MSAHSEHVHMDRHVYRGAAHAESMSLSHRLCLVSEGGSNGVQAGSDESVAYIGFD
mgnify:CR=1 FL=1